MPSTRKESLIAALEGCAAALEQRAWGSGTFLPEGSSLPRLRPQSGGFRIAPMTPEVGAARGPEVDSSVVREVRELSAEFHDAIRDVNAGTAGKGWINSLAGRASQFLEPDLVAALQGAARAYF